MLPWASTKAISLEGVASYRRKDFGNNHGVSDCSKLLKEPVEERWSRAKYAGVFFTCLKKSRCAANRRIKSCCDEEVYPGGHHTFGKRGTCPRYPKDLCGLFDSSDHLKTSLLSFTLCESGHSFSLWQSCLPLSTMGRVRSRTW